MSGGCKRQLVNILFRSQMRVSKPQLGVLKKKLPYFLIFADQLLDSTFIFIKTKIYSEIVFVYISYSIKFNIFF